MTSSTPSSKTASSPISRAAIARLSVDMMAAELAQTRGRSAMELGAATWGADTILDEEGLHLDSLERLNVSGALNAFFHLHEYGAEDYLLAMRTVSEWAELIEQSLAETGTHLTFETSGSTGKPKQCTHAVADLIAEAHCWAELAGPAGDKISRIVSLVPSHHIYGTIWTILLPQILGVPCDYRQLSPASAIAAAKKASLGQPVLVVAAPVIWEFLAKALPAFPEGTIGVSSTAPMPAGLAEKLSDMGLSRLIEVYGSSETGGIGWRDKHGASYRLLDYWSRSGGEAIVRAADNGPLEVQLMDNIIWQGERHLAVAGRRDGGVQVGGHNVFPDQIAEQLTEHDDIADAAIRLDKGTGRLKAFLVPREFPEEDGAFIQAIEAWCADSFSAPARPRNFTLGRELPRNAIGKLTDW